MWKYVKRFITISLGILDIISALFGIWSFLNNKMCFLIICIIVFIISLFLSMLLSIFDYKKEKEILLSKNKELEADNNNLKLQLEDKNKKINNMSRAYHIKRKANDEIKTYWTFFGKSLSDIFSNKEKDPSQEVISRYMEYNTLIENIKEE